MSWSDMPIKKDLEFECENCGKRTTHQCTLYKDAEYRKCTRCGFRTEWEPTGGRKLEKTSEKKEDRTKKADDIHRSTKRVHLTFRKKKQYDIDNGEE